jgi:hypothetical protein
MNHLYRLGACAALLLCAGAVEAQVGNRPVTPTRPTVSPYLNLTRQGNTALNYYNLVRPEFEFRNAYQSLQQQVRQNQTTIEEAGGVPTTGHTTNFQNYSHYFGGQQGVGVGRQLGPASSSLRPSAAPAARGGRR